MESPYDCFDLHCVIIYLAESDADSTDALKLENEKLRTQVESLKGIAEQNTNLMWSMQSYQYQADLARQQYSERLKEKEHEVECFLSVSCLKLAVLQGF